MRKALAVFALLLCSATPSLAQVSFGFSSPGVSIGINLPVYPDLVRIPGYPVYYAPQVDANYFFYDGLYWVFDGVNWYASTWYNGPWQIVTRDAVPLFLLRVPVRYYRERPAYFRGWALNAAPRWDAHWGRTWAQRHHGWDRWDRASTPAPAPLPTYQRRYAGNRYPAAGEQRTLDTRNYRYRPRDQVAQQQFRQGSAQRGGAPTAAQRGAASATAQRATPGPRERPVPPIAGHPGSAAVAGRETRAAPSMARHAGPPSIANGSPRPAPSMARHAGPPSVANGAPRAAPPMARHAGPPAVAQGAPMGRHGPPAAVANGAPRTAPPRGEARAAGERGPQARSAAQAANRGGNSAAHVRAGERRDAHNG